MSAPERRDPQDAVFAPEELLRALPTPCYVYDEAQLRTRAARLRSAFSWSAGFRAWFPVRFACHNCDCSFGIVSRK